MNPNNKLESVDNLKCGQCGNSIGSVAEACPKCGEIRTVGQDGKKYLEVDVAHAGETVERALAKLNQAVNEAFYGGYQGLRVVHGYGSVCNHTSRIKDAVKAQLVSFRKKYQGTISHNHNPGVTVWTFLR